MGAVVFTGSDTGRRSRAGLALASLIILGGCSLGGLGGTENPNADKVDPDETSGGIAGENESRLSDLQIFDFGASGGDLGGGLTRVNRYLWRASLDTLAFLPLNSTDPFTGVIATDWAASPDAPNERFKVAAYVKSPALSAGSLQVALFREVRDGSGAWVTAPVSGTSARQLEDAILLRARQLKIAEREGS